MVFIIWVNFTNSFYLKKNYAIWFFTTRGEPLVSFWICPTFNYKNTLLLSTILTFCFDQYIILYHFVVAYDFRMHSATLSSNMQSWPASQFESDRRHVEFTKESRFRKYKYLLSPLLYETKQYVEYIEILF